MYVFILTYVDLIKHLYSDGHITAEEASQLSAKKLFEVPPATPTTTAPPISLSSTTPSASSSSASTATPATSHDSFSSTFGLPQGINLKLPATGTTASGTTSISNVQQSTGSVTLPQRLGTTVGSQPSITVTPNTPLALSIATFPNNVSVKNVPAASAATASQAAVMAAKTGGQRAGLVTTSEAGQPGSLAFSDNVSQATSSAVSDASSNEGQSYYDDLVYDENDDTARGMTYHTVCEFSLDEISIKIHIYNISINALLIPVTSLHNNLFSSQITTPIEEA